MGETECLLVDARAQVKAALEAMDTRIPFALQADFAPTPPRGNTVVWGEWANVTTRCPVVDRLTFQVDIYAENRTARQELSQAVNRALTAMGLKRIYASADLYEDVGQGCYCKRFRFARKVDKRSMRLID